MSGWPIVKLGEVANFAGGGTPSRKVASYFGGSIPWVTVKDFKADIINETAITLTPDGLANSPSRIVPENTVLVVTRVGLGKVGVTGQPMALNQDIKAILPKADFDTSYLFHALKSKAPLIERMGTGATVKGITLRDLGGVEIPLPPLDEQRRIAARLDRAGALRRRAANAAERARALIPALFHDMFGDPATNPMGWDEVVLRDLLKSAQYGTSEKANEQDRGLPVIRMGNVLYDGALDTTDLKYVELEGKALENAALLPGDLLFNRTNSKELVGKTGIWDGRFEAVAASYFIRLRANTDLADPQFLWAFMNTPYMKSVLFKTARGAIGQSNINAKELKSFRVPLPPLPQQKRFVAHLDSIRRFDDRIDGAADKAARVTAALSNEVFGNA